MTTTLPLLRARRLGKSFRQGPRIVPALQAVDLEITHGEILALVGPSGCGKSTLARVAMRLMEPDDGALTLEGIDLLALKGRALRRARSAFQMVFQDPLAAFNPRATVERVLSDPLRIHGIAGRSARPHACAALLDRVGLPGTLLGRRIHEISGGQRQRVALARAIATRPRLLVLDEALSALDVSVRADIVSLLLDLRQTEGTGMLFISHDIGLVSAFADRIAVMSDGRIVEAGAASTVIGDPRSPVAKALVASSMPLPATMETDG